MKVKQNIGILNALIRITLGLTLLSWTTAKMVKKPWRDSYLLVAICAAMKVAEGIVRYCPVTALYENYQGNMNSGSSGGGHQSEGQHSRTTDGTTASRDSMEGVAEGQTPPN
ncbi:YgaP family membrane protein [Neobacillus sp. Marseille-QA0830]